MTRAGRKETFVDAMTITGNLKSPSLNVPNALFPFSYRLPFRQLNSYNALIPDIIIVKIENNNNNNNNKFNPLETITPLNRIIK
jgi:hypothetical protein